VYDLDNVSDSLGRIIRLENITANGDSGCTSYWQMGGLLGFDELRKGILLPVS
jgi:hypothetical protein